MFQISVPNTAIVIKTRIPPSPQKKETLSDYEYSVYLGFLLRKILLFFFCFSIIWLSGFDEDYSRNTLFAIN